MSDKDKKKGYRDTLNLPKTAFAMKANLTQREPQTRKAWDKQDIYDKILAARADAPLYGQQTQIFPHQADHLLQPEKADCLRRLTKAGQIVAVDLAPRLGAQQAVA